MSGRAPLSRATLEREERAMIEEVAGLVRREATLSEQMDRTRTQKVEAIGGLTTIRRVLGKPAEFTAEELAAASKPKPRRQAKAKRGKRGK